MKKKNHPIIMKDSIIFVDLRKKKSYTSLEEFLDNQ